jgi:thiamin-phosphate kinase
MPHELDLIHWIAENVANPDTLRDDTFWDASARRIYTTDMLIEGQHFDRAYFSAQDVGWKAAAVNISDIAATGGHFKALLISLGLPTHIEMPWIQDFYRGVAAACQQFGGVIAGGDTVGMPANKGNTNHPPLVINVTAIGECLPTEHPGHRFHAQPGDYVITTGFSGLSHVGLNAFVRHEAGYNESKAAHLRPQPRIEAGLLLSSRFERYALMDSSDGLADALIKIAQASQQAIQVESSQILLHPEVMAYAQAHGIDPWSIVLYGGEDFELVATIPEWDESLSPLFRIIGRVMVVEEGLNGEEEPGAWLRHSDTQSIQALSLDQTYQHFEAFAPSSTPKMETVCGKPSSAPKSSLIGETNDLAQVWAIVAAGGSSQRFSSEEDKLLANLNGQPVLQRTIAALLATSAIQGIIIVAGERQKAHYQTLIADCFPNPKVPLQWATGGATRRDSVFNGLCALPTGVGCVVIHDAARPLITPNTVTQAIQAVQIGRQSGAIVGVPVYDTLKRTRALKSAENDLVERYPIIEATCSRENMWRVQTPQVFRVSHLMQAHRLVSPKLAATDDAQLMEEAGFSLVMLPGQEDNLKITTREDLHLAEIFVNETAKKQRKN